MNSPKFITTLILMLSLSLASPAQAGILDYLKSWFITSQREQQAPAAMPAERPAPNQLPIVVDNAQPAATRGFWTRIAAPFTALRNRFSGWWHKDCDADIRASRDIINLLEATKNSLIDDRAAALSDRSAALRDLFRTRTENGTLEQRLRIGEPIIQEALSVNDELQKRSAELATLHRQCQELAINNHTFQNERDNLEKQLSEKEQELFNLRALKVSVTVTTEENEKLLAKLLAQHTDEISKSKKILAEKEAQWNAAKASHEEKEKKWKKDSELLLGLVDTEKAKRQEVMAEQQKTMPALQQLDAALQKLSDNFSATVNARLKKTSNKLDSMHERIENIKKQTSPVHVAVALAKVETDTKSEADKPSTTLALMQSHAPAPSNGTSGNATLALGSSWVIPDTKGNSNGHVQEKSKSTDFFDIDEEIQIDPKYREEQYKLGETHMAKILRGEHSKINTKEQEDYLRAIISLQWHFERIAKKKNENFIEGTFVIEDKGFKIYNFMMDYIKRFNKEITDTTQDPLSHYSYNQYGYSRDASHYVHLKKLFRPYGIDIRFGPDGKEQTLLPAGKRHILFGKIDENKQLIYIKPENHGLYFKDGLLGHIGEFAVAQTKKETWFGFISRSLLSAFGYTVSTDQGKGLRKERISSEFLRQFAEILEKDETFSSDQKKNLKAEAKKEGFKILCSIPIIQSASFKLMVTKYLAKYENTDHKKNETLANRTGDEVQLPSADYSPIQDDRLLTLARANETRMLLH